MLILLYFCVCVTCDKELGIIFLMIIKIFVVPLHPKLIIKTLERKNHEKNYFVYNGSFNADDIHRDESRCGS